MTYLEEKELIAAELVEENVLEAKKLTKEMVKLLREKPELDSEIEVISMQIEKFKDEARRISKFMKSKSKHYEYLFVGARF